MKIRNLIVAGFALCTMASCSKEEVDIYASGPVDASLSLNATTSLMMRSAEYGDTNVGTGKEALVKTLDVYVFKGTTRDNCMLHAYQNYTVADGAENLLTPDFLVKHLTVKKTKEEEQFVVYLVANCAPVASKTLSAFESSSIIGGNVTQYALGAYMPMSSKSIEFSSNQIKPLNDADGLYYENWIGEGEIKNQSSTTNEGHLSLTKPSGYAPVILNRLISRVQVKSITVNLVDNTSGNASFQLKALSLVNVPAQATVTGKGLLPYVKSYQSESFVVKDKQILSKADNTNGLFAEGGSTWENKLTKSYTALPAGTIDFTSEAYKDQMFYAYTFPNHAASPIASSVEGITEAKNYKTILLISGIYKAIAADPGTLKQFRVAIETPKEGNIVERNHIYIVAVTITGQGSSNEDGYEENAHVSATITVAPWNVVIQTEDDTN